MSHSALRKLSWEAFLRAWVYSQFHAMLVYIMRIVLAEDQGSVFRAHIRQLINSCQSLQFQEI